MVAAVQCRARGNDMEFVGERISVRKGPNGLSVQAMRSTAARGFWGDLWGRLTGQCVGICMAKIIIKTPTPGDPGEGTVDHVECSKGNCNCNCVSNYEDYGDGSAAYWCDCKK